MPPAYFLSHKYQAAAAAKHTALLAAMIIPGFGLSERKTYLLRNKIHNFPS